MKKHYPYLSDIQFLDKLYDQHNKTIYTRITVLDWWERPIEEVQGKITSASISENGDSSVRRTASLNVKIIDKDELYGNINSLFSINKKIFIETGLKNNLRHIYPLYKDYDTIWFPFGVFVIQNYSVTHDLTGISISLTLNDKMALLNGNAGGTIPASTNFDSYDTLGPDGDLHTEKIKINQIIPELVNHFGGEDLNNIVVNDIPNRIKMVQRWLSANPLYLYSSLSNSKEFFYTTMETESTISGYTKQMISYGYDCGYTFTDFVYPEELTANAGDSVCTILDKIKSTLGNYEYFYDVFGNFVFQEIKNYINTTEWRTVFNNYQTEPDLQLPYGYNRVLQSNVYDFSKNNFVVSYNNAPKFEMIKNDYVIWGARKAINGNTLPCRYHLAIDEKPSLEKDWNITSILTDGICFDISMDDKIKKAHYLEPEPVGTRFNTLDDLKSVFPEGIVGKYYLIRNENKVYSWVTDMESYQNAVHNYLTAGTSEDSIQQSSETSGAHTAGYVALDLATWYKGDNAFIVDKDTDWRNILYWQGLIASKTGSDTGYYWAELCNEWPKLYDVENGEYYEDKITAPSAFDWWLDFIDNDVILNKFSVKNIGRRSFSRVETDCNCVFEPNIPDIIMVNINDMESQVDVRTDMTLLELKEQGLVPVQVDPAISDSTGIGGTFNSCYEYIRQLIQDYTDYNETISLTCIPIYHLEPNTRIHLDDPESGIYGDYIINTISYTLGNNGTMSLTAKKVNEKM